MVPVDSPTKLPSDGGREGSVRLGLCAASPGTTLLVFAAALCVRGRSDRCIGQHDKVMRPAGALLGPFPWCLGGLGRDLMLLASAFCAEMACVASTQLVSGVGAALGAAVTVGMGWIRSYSDGLARINALRGQQDDGLVRLSPTGSLRLTCHFRR